MSESQIVASSFTAIIDEELHAALDINVPNYASAIVTTNEIIDLITSVQTLGIGAQ